MKASDARLLTDAAIAIQESELQNEYEEFIGVIYRLVNKKANERINSLDMSVPERLYRMVNASLIENGYTILASKTLSRTDGGNMVLITFAW